MTTTTGAAAEDMTAGLAIPKAIRKRLVAAGMIPIIVAAAGAGTPRATPRLRAAAGKSMAVPAAAIATMTAAAPCLRVTMKAGLPVRGRFMTMTTTTGAVARDMAAGTATRSDTRQPRTAAGESGFLGPAIATTMTMAGTRAHAMTTMMMTAAAAADTAAGTATRKDILKRRVVVGR